MPDSTRDIQYGYCHCGCGQKTTIPQETHRGMGRVAGQPMRYVSGHNRIIRGEGPNPSGLCQCGCGERTNLAPFTVRARGEIGGKPLRFVAGHQRRKTSPAYEVDPQTGCWNWLRVRDHGGYGRTFRAGRLVGAHRAEWERVNGAVPGGMMLDHMCRNPQCVNPDHLRIVTNAENVRCGNTAKITADDVRRIRALVTSGMTQSKAAVMFGIGQTHVSRIVRREVWKDVD